MIDHNKNILTKNKTHKIQNFILLIFVFFFPYENWNIFLNLGLGSILKIIGLFYILSSYVYISFVKNKVIWHSFYMLIFFYLWLLLRNIFQLEIAGNYLFPLLNNVIMTIVIVLHLSYIGHKFLTKVLFFFALSVGILSIALFFFPFLGVEFVDNRLYFMGNNPNDFSYFIDVAIVVLIYFIAYDIGHFGMKRYFLLAILPFLFRLLASTGSRGGIIILVVAFFVFFLSSEMNLKRKLYTSLLLVFVGYFALKIITENEFLLTRFSKLSNQENTLGGRAEIWAVSYKIFKENVLIGAGFEQYRHQMLENLGEIRSSHNAYLYLLSIGGLPAFLLFFYFLFKVYKFGYKSRIKTLYFTLLIMQIIYMSKSGSFFGYKLLWFIFAILIASSNIGIQYSISQNNKVNKSI